MPDLGDTFGCLGSVGCRARRLAMPHPRSAARKRDLPAARGGGLCPTRARCADATSPPRGEEARVSRCYSPRMFAARLSQE